MRCRVMGVLNVTPDSFSDGGRHLDHASARTAGLALHAAGADIVDVGGESTRPGAARVPEAVEAARVLPVIHALAAAGMAVSVDTTRAAIAAAAIDAGAVMVNDVSGGRQDPAMHRTVAAADGVDYVLGHWRAPSAVMDQHARYDDVVDEVATELRLQVDRACAAGIDKERIVVDPGLGFAKELDHNWALLAALPTIGELGLRTMVGASRKRFLASLPGDAAGAVRPPGERDAATVATTVWAALHGAWAVRVHAVRPSVDALAVVGRLLDAGERP
ncbi:dihydropteroate synthase [Nocardioides humi]|uniref:Dihydropteroate synthase n=1 Tax=Nocardioides humi TaxID=449461 RepID=A0ABN1ZYG7_9ACTN|nr:dihydropteroate synthase [Nocardioides humi]